jgi:hypothetical protein
MVFSERERHLRAELAAELGYLPASLKPRRSNGIVS